MRITVVVGLVSIAFAALPSSASAVHWPLLGGDAGRSGHQPVEPARAPFPLAYVKNGFSEQNVVTSIVTTAGAPDVQRFAFATSQGNVHMQRLADGAPIGPEEGVDVTEGYDPPTPFGGRGGAFADTSTPQGLGQLFVGHAALDDGLLAQHVAITQFDEASGDRVRSTKIRGTDGFTLRGPLLVTGADAAGNRTLFFTADAGSLTLHELRLFRVPITAASSRGAELGTPTSVEVPEGHADSIPSLAFLADDTGATAAHVVVPSGNGVHSYRASDLRPGPAFAEAAGSATFVATPVTASGIVPGAPMSGAPRAPYLLAMVENSQGTEILRLVQTGNALERSAASDLLPGAPGVAFSVTQLAGSDGGLILVPTSDGVYALDALSLRGVGAFTDVQPPVHEEPPEGFTQTAPAVAGATAFIARDNGEQLALSLPGLRRLPGGDFEPSEFNRRSGRSVGQPSLSRRAVQFASDRGVSVYLGAPPSAAQQPPPTAPAPAQSPTATPRATACVAGAPGTRADDELIGGGGRDRLSGGRGEDVLLGRGSADCLDGGRGDDLVSGGAGADRIRGGSGTDRLVGGSGADRIHARDGRRDLVRCGAGSDVAIVDRSDRVSGCERVRRA